ncbi:unnamed protein product [Caenorhabditis nigoni]
MPAEEGSIANDNVFVLEMDGFRGDLHCMTCLKICNYEEGAYCCDAMERMPEADKKRESDFFKICLQRHAIDQMVKALIAGKKVVDNKGKCVFCRTSKQHNEEKWCERKTVMELYLHQVDKEERKIDRHLERFLNTRLQNKKQALNQVQARITREMKAAHEQMGMNKFESIHILNKQGRDARKMQRREIEHVETENENIRKRLAKKLLVKREQTEEKIRNSERPAIQFERGVQHPAQHT